MRGRVDYYRKRAYEMVNYRLRSFAGGRFTSRCRPTSIVFLLTELCNARCLHCDIWKNKGREDAPTPDQWKTVLTDLRRWLGPVQILFSGGEALMRPFTVDLVDCSSRLGLFLEVLTHGFWKDQTKIEKLARANPWRVTVSVDAASETHSKIRGWEGFYERTFTTIETLKRVRKQEGLDFTIRLKTVIMSHNLDEVCEVARFATQDGMHVFYQPVEQNYNTPEDKLWYEGSDNWPRDPERAVAVVGQLIELKKQGHHIYNSVERLEAMIPYFRSPDSMRVTTQSHQAHERRAMCAALTTLQLQANGDVTVCYGKPPVGNIKTQPVREIWERRPRFWDNGCCFSERFTEAEKETYSLPVVS